jgi:hypothetical protein
VEWSEQERRWWYLLRTAERRHGIEVRHPEHYWEVLTDPRQHRLAVRGAKAAQALVDRTKHATVADLVCHTDERVRSLFGMSWRGDKVRPLQQYRESRVSERFGGALYGETLHKLVRFLPTERESDALVRSFWQGLFREWCETNGARVIDNIRYAFRDLDPKPCPVIPIRARRA